MTRKALLVGHYPRNLAAEQEGAIQEQLGFRGLDRRGAEVPEFLRAGNELEGQQHSVGKL